MTDCQNVIVKLPKIVRENARKCVKKCVRNRKCMSIVNGSQVYRRLKQSKTLPLIKQQEHKAKKTMINFHIWTSMKQRLKQRETFIYKLTGILVLALKTANKWMRNVKNRCTQLVKKAWENSGKWTSTAENVWEKFVKFVKNC